MTRVNEGDTRPASFRATSDNLEATQNTPNDAMLQHDGEFYQSFMYFEVGTEGTPACLNYEDTLELYETLGDSLAIANAAKDAWKRKQRETQIEVNTAKFLEAGLGVVIQETDDARGNFTGKLFINVGNDFWVREGSAEFSSTPDFLNNGKLTRYEFIKD